ncbi:alpha/beta fold hydrolase [Allobranchiibius huperziae]|uniref:Pimeloyl-ACP methyl ester carboxylesterase n=1 Tax=Allobranchiibius huperziae TaxID=1874116 RepID=A0A853DC61_9MICO|nr:alpha/beta hydrolase [Allobranchiibius huperziae]NYJ73553.1 pimeloyl-ACP methyl ester carboxylesterase [Allobranchiibius huperziae]
MGNPLVVFVPGLGLDELEWERVRARLDRDSVVVVLPTMGQPAPRGLDLRVEAQAALLARRLPRNAPLILVAHSASCPIAADLASRSGDVVGLVLVGPVTDPAAASWPRLLVQWARTAVREPWWQLPALFRQWARTGPGSMIRGMNAVRPFRTDHALRSVQAPVAIVRGERDQIAAKEWSATVQSASGGHLSTVRGAAHMVPTTHPDAVVDAAHHVLAAVTAAERLRDDEPQLPI